MWYGKCPDDFEIEQYYYGQLPFLKSLLVKAHIKRCSRCSHLVADVERFDKVLLSVPVVESPKELPDLVMQRIREMDYGFGLSSESSLDAEYKTVLLSSDDEKRSSGTVVFSPKTLWAAATLLVIIGVAFRHTLGGYGLTGRGTYIMGWSDIEALWEILKSNALLTTLNQIIGALRVDTISTLRVLAGSLPNEVFNVLLCGCIIVAFCIRKVFSTRSGGCKHEKTL